MKYVGGRLDPWDSFGKRLSPSSEYWKFFQTIFVFVYEMVMVNDFIFDRWEGFE